MAAITYIGSTLSYSTAAPATEDADGYGALAWTEVGKIISVAELRDSSEDVAIDLLKSGRRKHVNGVRDIGALAVATEYDGGDTGQDEMRSKSGTNDSLRFRLIDVDDQDYYFQALVANYRVTERTASSFKGGMFEIRGQSAIITDGPVAILISHSTLSVAEGSLMNNYVSYWAKLAAQPSATVTVTITWDPAADAVVGNMGSRSLLISNDTFTFTTANWDTWQEVRLRAPQDSDTDSEEVTLTHTGANGGYDNIARDLVVTVVDDD